MQVFSCERPNHIFNKYSNEWLWTRCGKCPSCLNARAAKYVYALQREEKEHPYCFFVTLTYDEVHLPLLRPDKVLSYDMFQKSQIDDRVSFTDWSVRSRDEYTKPFDIPFSAFEFDDIADSSLFFEYLDARGIPYASKYDIQLFHKRLNQYFNRNVTSTFKNFRYFVCSEYGSTTLRPHFHGIYFVDRQDVAERFADAVFLCWKYGRTDTKPVESSAPNYVAQYVNKLSCLPSFYRVREIRPFFLQSKFPVIGSYVKSESEELEDFDSCSPIRIVKDEHSNEVTAVPMLQSHQNRLFPKCFAFGRIPNSLRIELYGISEKFGSLSCREFVSAMRVWSRLPHLSSSDIDLFNLLGDSIDCALASSVDFIKRLYYTSRKVLRLCSKFCVSLYSYVNRIDEFFSNKQLYVLSHFYEMQESVSQTECDTIALCYPEFVHQTYGSDVSVTRSVFARLITDSLVVSNYFADQKTLYYSSKQTHFKNMYLESLENKNNPLFKILKKFYYAKKCDETLKTFAP